MYNHIEEVRGGLDVALAYAFDNSLSNSSAKNRHYRTLKGQKSSISGPRERLLLIAEVSASHVCKLSIFIAGFSGDPTSPYRAAKLEKARLEGYAEYQIQILQKDRFCDEVHGRGPSTSAAATTTFGLAYRCGLSVLSKPWYHAWHSGLFPGQDQSVIVACILRP